MHVWSEMMMIAWGKRCSAKGCPNRQLLWFWEGIHASLKHSSVPLQFRCQEMNTGYFTSSPVLAWQFLWAWLSKGGQGVELPLLTLQQWSPQLAANWMLNMIDKVLAITHENIINWFEKCKTYLELLAPRMCGLLPSTRSARKLIKEFSFHFLSWILIKEN